MKLRAYVALACFIASFAVSARGQCSGFLPMPGWSPDGPVFALQAWDPDGAGSEPTWLIVAGDFTNSPAGSPPGLAAWDGTAWRRINGGVNGPIHGMGIYRGELIVCGVFTQAGSVAVSNVARYSLANGWRRTGGGEFSGPVNAVAEYQGELYAGGDFNYRSAPGAPDYSPYIARWNGGAQWIAMPGLNARIHRFAIFDGSLYFASYQSGYVNFQRNIFFAGPSNAYDLVPVPGSLVFVGSFAFGTQFGPLNSACRLQNGQLFPLDSGPQLGGPLYSVCTLGDRVLMGGNINRIDAVPTDNIALWSFQQGWTPISPGTDGPVLALTSIGSVAYVGGFFDSAGGPGRAGPYLARFTLLDQPVITQQPANAFTELGQTAQFPVAATVATGPLTYQWLADGQPISNGPGGVTPFGGVVSGADTPTLTITNVQVRDAGEFRCRILNSCATTLSAPVRLAVSPACDPDFNRDGNVDQADVDALINVAAGGDCP